MDVVVITHAHPDHVGGLTDASAGDRAPVFSNARHVISRVEWDFWHSEDVSGPSAHIAPRALTHLNHLDASGLLDVVDGETELGDGIRTLATPGHTPGHVSVVVSSRGDTALVAGDVIMTEWSFAHPDWCAEPEVDPALSVATRTALLERAARDDLVVTAYHVPGVGRVPARGAGFAFVGR